MAFKMKNPFLNKAAKSNSPMQSNFSPTKHKVDGSWKGHDHESFLGKLTNPEIRKQISKEGYEFDPLTTLSYDKEKGVSTKGSAEDWYNMLFNRNTESKGSTSGRFKKGDVDDRGGMNPYGQYKEVFKDGKYSFYDDEEDYEMFHDNFFSELDKGEKSKYRTETDESMDAKGLNSDGTLNMDSDYYNSLSREEKAIARNKDWNLKSNYQMGGSGYGKDYSAGSKRKQEKIRRDAFNKKFRPI